jgi:hypothetical protein
MQPEQPGNILIRQQSALGSQPTSATDSIWGPYRNYEDEARWQYGRQMWRLPDMRRRLLQHWLDERHPWRERFIRHRALIEEILTSDLPEEQLHHELLSRGTSLRCAAREIPPVFGSFFHASNP